MSENKPAPVDHRHFITGFDATGFMEAVNSEWRKREAELQQKINSLQATNIKLADKLDKAQWKIADLEGEIKSRQVRDKNCSRHIKELDAIHEHLGGLGIRYAATRKSRDGNDEFHRFLMSLRDAWTKVGHKWPWEMY